MKVAVLGNVFIDYKGWVTSAYDPSGRNQGKIEILHGGVARNVAENIACLGIETQLITTLGTDSATETVIKRLTQNNVGFDYTARYNQNAIGMWLAILGKNGELLSSVTQLPDMQLLEELVLEKMDEITLQNNAIAMDIDLTSRIADRVVAAAQKNQTKLYALPGNLTVIYPNKHLFTHMECFICNDIEAGKLLDMSIDPQDITKAQELAQTFCRTFKLKQLVITLGEHGAVYCDPQGQIGFQPIYPTSVKDSTGAGDAFFSATVAALLRGKTLDAAVDAGARLAAIIISRNENTCYELTPAQLKNIFVK